MIRVIGIESSCDNTCFTLMDSNRVIFYSFNLSQDSVVKKIGGYIPRVISDNHVDAFNYIISNINIDTINSVDYVSVTAGPGLMLCLLLGYKLAQLICKLHNKPIFLADHIEGHILSNLIDNVIDFPYLSITMTGGHFLIVLVHDIGSYTLLSYTLDDAPGEVLDKIARKLDLPFFNGREIEKEAETGWIAPELCSTYVNIRDPKLSHASSFSGFKTRFIYAIESKRFNSNDIAKTAQHVLFSYILKKVYSFAKDHNIKRIAFNGGVSSNKYFRHLLLDGFDYFFTKYSTDNAEMIAFSCIKYIEKFGKNTRFSKLNYGDGTYDSMHHELYSHPNMLYDKH